MDKLRGQSRDVAARPRRSRVWQASFLVAAIVFACGFGYAAVTWKLFSPDGTVALEYLKAEPGDILYDDVDTAALRDMLAEGEAAVFYLKEQNRYIGLVNERKYTEADYADFAAKTGSRAPLRELGDGFVFEEGTLVHNMISSPTMVNWADPAAEANVSYRKVPLGETVGYSAVYSDDRGHRLTLSAMFNIPGRQIYTDELDQLRLEKIMVDSVEAFYIRELDQEGHRMAWAEGEGEQHVYYTLYDSAANKLTRESLEKAAAVIIRK